MRHEGGMVILDRSVRLTPPRTIARSREWPTAGAALRPPAIIVDGYAGLTSTCFTLADGVAVLPISSVSTPLAKRAAIALVSASAGRVKARVKLPWLRSV